MDYKTKKVGFIGAGNMAEAIFGGLVKSGALAAENITVTDISPEKIESAKSAYGVNGVLNDSASNAGAKKLAEESDILIFAVKPQVARGALEAVGEMAEGKIAFSIMGGVPTAFIENYLGKTPLVRIMPNTPMKVLEGAAGICAGTYATEETVTLAKELFSHLGKAIVLEERLIDALTAISGCGPAFAYMFIEALAESGVALGLSFADALALSAQTMLGAAKMVLESGRHPAEL